MVEGLYIQLQKGRSAALENMKELATNGRD